MENPAARAAHNKRKRVWIRGRMEDSGYRERVNAQARERYRERMKDPVFRERERARPRGLRKLIPVLGDRDGPGCRVPGCPVLDVAELQVDHVRPRVLFGEEDAVADELGNLQLLCGPHNCSKRDAVWGEWVVSELAAEVTVRQRARMGV